MKLKPLMGVADGSGYCHTLSAGGKTRVQAEAAAGPRDHYDLLTLLFSQLVEVSLISQCYHSTYL